MYSGVGLWALGHVPCFYSSCWSSADVLFENMTEVTQIPHWKRQIQKCCKCVTDCRNGSRRTRPGPRTNHSPLFRSAQVLPRWRNTQRFLFLEKTLRTTLRNPQLWVPSWYSHPPASTALLFPPTHLAIAQCWQRNNRPGKGALATCSENGKQLGSARGWLRTVECWWEKGGTLRQRPGGERQHTPAQKSGSEGHTSAPISISSIRFYPRKGQKNRPAPSIFLALD